MSTEFQKQVYDALMKIPKGYVTTYGDIARYIGRPRAVRAVGSACGANPDLIVVPCHRVVTSNGSVGQYARGVTEKKSLLKQEGINIVGNKVQDFQTVHYRFTD